MNGVGCTRKGKQGKKQRSRKINCSNIPGRMPGDQRNTEARKRKCDCVTEVERDATETHITVPARDDLLKTKSPSTDDLDVDSDSA